MLRPEGGALSHFTRAATMRVLQQAHSPQPAMIDISQFVLLVGFQKACVRCRWDTLCGTRHRVDGGISHMSHSELLALVCLDDSRLLCIELGR